MVGLPALFFQPHKESLAMADSTTTLTLNEGTFMLIDQILQDERGVEEIDPKEVAEVIVNAIKKLVRDNPTTSEESINV